MGLFDYFKRRRERESVVEGLEITADPSSRVEPLSASTFGAGTQAPAATATAGLDLAQLGQIGAMIAQAARQGEIQVHEGEPQTIDLRGSGLREEILGIMSQHGIDPEATSAEGIDADQMPEMQQQILDAIGRQGVDLSAYLGGGDASPDAPGGEATSSE